MGALGCSRIRVDAFYMKANYAGKVSNLTVTPHRNISLIILNTITNITEAPLLYSLAPLHRGYLTDINELAAESSHSIFPMALNI